MASNQLIGTIFHIGVTESPTDNFSKKEFIVFTDGETNFPNHIRMECQNSHISQLDGLKKGDKVKVDYNLRGRLKKGDETQAFNTLQAWKIQKA